MAPASVSTSTQSLLASGQGLGTSTCVCQESFSSAALALTEPLASCAPQSARRRSWHRAGHRHIDGDVAAGGDGAIAQRADGQAVDGGFAQSRRHAVRMPIAMVVVVGVVVSIAGGMRMIIGGGIAGRGCGSGLLVAAAKRRRDEREARTGKKNEDADAAWE